jgi:predicted Fe-Mo cluster-binding NifX family protein
MKIIIPMDGDDLEQSKICLVSDAKHWLYFEINEGRMQNEKFYDTKEDIKEYFDMLIISTQTQDVEQFINEGVGVLVAPLQIYVEDIVEAYIFKELHDLSE